MPKADLIFDYQESPVKGMVLATAVLALSGCASTSDVPPMGDGKYTVDSKVRGGLPSSSEVKAMAINKGADYCRALGKEISDVKVETHGVRSLTPQEAEVEFRCASMASN